MGSKLSGAPMPGGPRKDPPTGTAGRRILQAEAGTSPGPYLFPGGEDDIFRDPFGDFVPSSR